MGGAGAVVGPVSTAAGGVLCIGAPTWRPSIWRDIRVPNPHPRHDGGWVHATFGLLGVSDGIGDDQRYASDRAGGARRPRLRPRSSSSEVWGSGPGAALPAGALLYRRLGHPGYPGPHLQLVTLSPAQAPRSQSNARPRGTFRSNSRALGAGFGHIPAGPSHANDGPGGLLLASVACGAHF